MRTAEGIAVKLLGGLGNQLFQYAAARATSLRLGCDLVLDTTSLERDPQRSYMLDAFRIRASVGVGQVADSWVEYHQPGYCFDPSFDEIAVGTRLHGYFQSEAFFASHREQIRQELRLAVPVSDDFSALSRTVQEAAYPVSIHFRRGDFVNNPATFRFHGICGEEYYAKAMRIIEGLSGSRPMYFVFSDEPVEARAFFAGLGAVELVETPPQAPWEDMLLITQCRDHILANSSFSWWAAWLNPLPTKTIVAPRRWVSPEALRSLNTADLYLEGTITI
jgi:hypothetical protein